MGAPMALRLLAAGHELSVWNRTEGRTKPLIREGAIAAATPAEAELGADAVITMLFDDAAQRRSALWPQRTDGRAFAGRAAHFVQHHQRGAERAADRGARAARASTLWPRRSSGGPTWPRKAGCGSWRPARRTPSNSARPLLEPLSRGISVVGRSRARPTPSSWAATSSSVP